MDKNSGRGRSSPPPSALPDPQSKAPAGSRKPKAKVVGPKKRKDKRGTPKGKGTVKRPNGSRIGNPPFVATEEHRRLVMILTATGHEQWFIAAKILNHDNRPISIKTLQKHFRQDIDEAVSYANAELGGVLYQGALAGDAKKLEMWFDRRGGPEWRKKSGVEVSGPGGAPIEYRELSDEELETRIAARLSSHAAGTAKA